MTPADAIKELDELNDGPEESHLEAERVLCALLRDLGHADVVEAFFRLKKRAGFWYA
jgi:hypothetical protein